MHAGETMHCTPCYKKLTIENQVTEDSENKGQHLYFFDFIHWATDLQIWSPYSLPYWQFSRRLQYL